MSKNTKPESEVRPEAYVPYPVPAGPHEAVEIIRRSKFTTFLAPAETAYEAKAFVATVRANWPDATHHCWAFVAGPPGSSASIGMSDDGEPHGTAGRPMLTALLHSGVGDIVAVSARYYGGVKLGTGGLARAYSGGVTLALETLPTKLKVDRIQCHMVIGYGAVTAMERILEELDVTVEATDYGERVTFVGLVPAARISDLKRAVADATRGQGRVDLPED